MRLDRFYSDNFEFIENEEFHHLYRVLRHKKGDKILVFDGKGNEYICEILEILKDKAKIKPIEKLESREYHFHIAIAQALIKKERFEIFLEKSVELGVKEIYPIITKYSVVKLEEKKERWEKIIINACKQSHRQIVPKLHNIKSLTEIIEISKDYDLRIFGSVHSKKNILEFEKSDKVLIVIGPEGGLSEDEELLLKEHEFLDFSLGNFILRSETASIVAISSIILNLRRGTRPLPGGGTQLFDLE
ncbi:MAG: RsmE family RNA methyltransferase [candidate division WOR-3 bacterium]|jgi:16S rRNA (uracil1498-N3)-methyltransferase